MSKTERKLHQIEARFKLFGDIKNVYTPVLSEDIQLLLALVRKLEAALGVARDLASEIANCDTGGHGSTCQSMISLTTSRLNLSLCDCHVANANKILAEISRIMEGGK